MFKQIDGKRVVNFFGALKELKRVNSCDYSNVKLQVTFIKYH